MFNFSKKRTIIGLSGFAVSVGLTVLFALLAPSGGITELPAYGILFRILSVFFVSSALAFLGYVFGGSAGFLFIFLPLLLVTALQIILSFTSEFSPYLGLWVIALVGVGIVSLTSYRQYRFNNIVINGESALSENQRKKREQFENETRQLMEEDREMKESIGYLVDSVVVATPAAGNVFQVIKRSDGYHFHRVGNILKNLDRSRFITDFSYEAPLSENKNDYLIRYEDIDGFSANVRPAVAAFDYGSLKIKLKNGKSKKFTFINLLEENELKGFFGENISVKTKTSADKTAAPEFSEKDKAKMNALNMFFFVYSLVSAVVFGLYFTCMDKTAYTVLTTLCILICIVPYVLYAVFQQYLSIKSPDVAGADNRKIIIMPSTFIFPLLFVLMAMLDFYIFIYYDILKLVIYSAVLFAVLAALFFIFTKEYKKKKDVAALAMIVILLLSPAIVHKIDIAYDYSAPLRIACEIIEKPTWTDNNGNVTYYFVIDYKGKEIKTEVEKKTYEAYETGNSVGVIAMNGALGIEKTVTDETE